jgi:hypothetical protein
MSSKKSPPTPQLGRKIYSLDDASSSDDSDGLEIVMPLEKSKANTIPGKAGKASASVSAAAIAPKRKKPVWEDSSDSSDSDDEVMAMARAALARPAPNKVAAKRNASKTTPSSSSSSSSSSAPKAAPPRKQPSPKARDNNNNNNNSKKQQESEEEKRRKRIQTLEARLQKKKETEQRKQQDKVARAQQRDDQRQAKERQKQVEKGTKKRQKEEADQSNGKNAHREIVALIDPDVYNHSEYALVETFAEDFLLHSYTSALTCPKAVQWIRKEFLQGGAQEALKHLESSNESEEHYYEHLPQVMLILESDDFLPLLQRVDGEEDSGFPGLKTWLDSLISRWQHVWKTSSDISPKLILLLHQIPEALDRVWVDHRRQKKKSSGAPSPPTEWDFQDAIQWLLIQFQVECVLCPNIESVQSNFHKMTRGLAEAPYADQVTELQCVKKIKAQTTTDADDFPKAKDIWTRQLQMLPQLSEPMARSLAQSFPTMQSLWQAYQEGGDDDKNIDQGQLVAGDLSKARRYVKLSQAVHRVMTSDNPNEMIL